ncbi:MAG: hypothetical protein H3C43_03530 [Leptonema sp. (in: Bacteria)]|nr:hypothetical protein [Leptonema sp. (in: bacteria)]
MVSLLLIVEFSIRYLRADLESDRRYRLAHCFENQFLLLCPLVSGEFLRPDKSKWHLQTDERSLRVTPSSKKRGPTIWWIGDSITMGYLLNDHETAPEQFSRFGFNVQNLGSDSIGTLGIQYRLKKAIQQLESKPSHIFWIYNTSDFVDDLKDIRIKESFFYRSAFRLHYQISKYSTLYLLLRSHSASDMNQLPPGFLKAPAKNHPTFQNLLSLKNFLKQNNLSVTILVYPGFDPTTKKPALLDPTTQALIDFLNKNKNKNENQEALYFDFIDMRPKFDNLIKQNIDLYLPIDGHPNQEAAALFSITAFNYLKQLQ